ncbi:MAG: hypothetical protein IH941_10705 [Acidobacteria bacterium]|nr:hypothetical protein [Acidobacteriota bacterium]
MSTTTTQTHVASTPQRTLLGRAMIENALFSGLSGITLALGAPGFDSWLGVNAWVLVAIAIGLMIFALDLFTWARSSRWLRRGAMIAVTGDVLWVIGAVALIVFTDVLTSAGEIALLVVTAVVAVFAVMQTVGLVRVGHKEA